MPPGLFTAGAPSLKRLGSFTTLPANRQLAIGQLLFVILSAAKQSDYLQLAFATDALFSGQCVKQYKVQ
jgi:hypothetical protein